jgi:outer membrane protein assembly factor BamB
VFISSGYGVGGAMLKVRQEGGRWSAEELWRTRELKCRFTTPVVSRNHLYGLDEGFLVCLDADTGEVKWRGDRYGHGQVLLSEDLLVIQAETGELCLVKASPEGFAELTRFRALDNPAKNWNTPALAGGKAYLRNHEEMACYDLTAPGTEGPASPPSAGDKGKADAP